MGLAISKLTLSCYTVSFCVSALTVLVKFVAHSMDREIGVWRAQTHVVLELYTTAGWAGDASFQWRLEEIEEIKASRPRLLHLLQPATHSVTRTAALTLRFARNPRMFVL